MTTLFYRCSLKIIKDHTFLQMVFKKISMTTPFYRCGLKIIKDHTFLQMWLKSYQRPHFIINVV